MAITNKNDCNHPPQISMQERSIPLMIFTI